MAHTKTKHYRVRHPLVCSHFPFIDIPRLIRPLSLQTGIGAAMHGAEEVLFFLLAIFLFLLEATRCV